MNDECVETSFGPSVRLGGVYEADISNVRTKVLPQLNAKTTFPLPFFSFLPTSSPPYCTPFYFFCSFSLFSFFFSSFATSFPPCYVGMSACLYSAD